MKKNQQGSATVAGLLLLVYAAFVVALVYGWVSNIINLIVALKAGAGFGLLTLLQGLGVPFFPLGVILGWFV